jgi:hypothetical protein
MKQKTKFYISNYFKICLIIVVFNCTANAQSITHTDILVVGGGTGGTAAGIQAARLGVATTIVENSPWLGGMLSAAGVSATDGNHSLPSGFWNEFRNELYKAYGGPKKLETGWVSNMHFEPHVADSIFKAIAAKIPKLKIIYGFYPSRVIKKDKSLQAIVFTNAKNELLTIYAKQIIDATELGDIIAFSKTAYSLGMEAGSTTGENVGVKETNGIIQDLTYTAILKDYGPKADCTIVKPKYYNPSEFDASNKNFYHDSTRKAPGNTAQNMLNYAKLPNHKYLLNWPIFGNDTYLDVVEMSEPQRNIALEKAKATTLRFVYFIQNELGFKNLGLANDEFPSPDRLALMPYHREGRRLKGIVRFTMPAIAEPFDFPLPLYRTGISVGDYPIDHHHKKNGNAPQQLEFYPIPSYNLPLGSLIPETTENLIAAEKGISVSNVVNGTTRLQPVVLLTGQAAGILASLAVKRKVSARKVPVRLVQQELLNNHAMLIPYIDVDPTHPNFTAIHKIGATGILRGKPIPYKWANQTWFYPDSLVESKPFLVHFATYSKVLLPASTDKYITWKYAKALINNFMNKTVVKNKVSLSRTILDFEMKYQLHNNDYLKRAIFAEFINDFIDPFSTPIDHFGNFIR